MNQVSFSRGDVIFREGTYGETMYEITAGSVGIYAGYGTEDEQLIATLGEGETFGEMGLVEFWARSATAVALEDGTSANEMSTEELSDCLRDQPEKVLSIMRQLSARLRETNKRYEEACRTVYDAVESENKGEKRETGLRARLTAMLHRASRRER